MVGVAFNDLNVTTWDRTATGEQIWRASTITASAEFTAPRDSEHMVLLVRAQRALGIPLSDNASYWLECLNQDCQEAECEALLAEHERTGR